MRANIDISGIRDFQRQLRQIDPGMPKMLRTVHNGAADLVVTNARPKVARRTGAAAASLKARSNQREGRVAAGGRKAPYYPWLDFGGSVGPDDSVKRPFYTEGRYVYPTVREQSAEIERVMSDGLIELAAGAGLEVT
ncbi:MAG TPA: HK97 gp10 family phage protein [Myxococcota bacterium]|nr:HK97 gp10 family phage protein [Myxococcota bacterium]